MAESHHSYVTTVAVVVTGVYVAFWAAVLALTVASGHPIVAAVAAVVLTPVGIALWRRLRAARTDVAVDACRRGEPPK